MTARRAANAGEEADHLLKLYGGDAARIASMLQGQLTQLATRAQMRMCEGAFGEAHRLYDKAIELSEPGSEFLVYLNVLKCTAALAADDRATVDALAAKLFAINPVIRMQLGLFLASPTAELPADLAAALGSFDAARAQLYRQADEGRIDLAEVTLANFNGPNQLKRLDGGAFAATDESGPAVLGAPQSTSGCRRAVP